MAITTPISYYKLDESSGNASDSVGSNTLTNVGTATYSAGKINNGVNLNGSSQYFTFGTSPQTGAGSWSVNVWVKTSASGSQNEFMFWGSNSTDNGIDLYKNSSNKLQANFYGGGGIATSTTSINTGSWVMCTVTYDGTNIRVYVNGVLENTGANRTGAISGSNRYVGADGGVGNFWNGSLDELGTWSVTLTANDINLLYNAGLGNQYPFTGATVKALVVGGGGGGGSGGNDGRGSGGGGAGQYQYNNAFFVTPQAYSITVGNGGAGGTTSNGTNGTSSIFDSITSTSGGGGGGDNTALGLSKNGSSGASGGGAKAGTPSGATGGTATAGFAGGNSPGTINGGGGGGGSSAVGVNGATTVGGDGGAGTANSISGASVTYAGGGGAGSQSAGTAGTGTGGGGNGNTSGTGFAATANTGGGGGGSGAGPGAGNGGNGGSGVVIISYATNGSDGVSTSSTGGTITTSGGQTIHTFTSSGTWTMVASSLTNTSAFFNLM